MSCALPVRPARPELVCCRGSSTAAFKLSTSRYAQIKTSPYPSLKMFLLLILLPSHGKNRTRVGFTCYVQGWHTAKASVSKSRRLTVCITPMAIQQNCSHAWKPLISPLTLSQSWRLTPSTRQTMKRTRSETMTQMSLKKSAQRTRILLYPCMWATHALWSSIFATASSTPARPRGFPTLSTCNTPWLYPHITVHA